MRYYNFNNYRLSMRETNMRDSYGHVKITYKFTSPQGDTIFEGDNFGASPLHSPTGKTSAIALLSFLTLSPGDTDKEYFENYTPRQMEFALSYDAELLKFIVCDYEERKQ